MFQLLHLLPEVHSSHISVNCTLSGGGRAAQSWTSVSSPCAFLPKEQIVVAFCLEHEIPSLEPEWDTICYLFVLSQTFQWHGCVLGIKASHPLHFSFALQFQQDYYCSLFYQVWQTCQWLGFRAVCPGILAYCPLEQKTDWTDVSDTLCDASPTNPVCGICCERLMIWWLWYSAAVELPGKKGVH